MGTNSPMSSDFKKALTKKMEGRVHKRTLKGQHKYHSRVSKGLEPTYKIQVCLFPLSFLVAPRENQRFCWGTTHI